MPWREGMGWLLFVVVAGVAFAAVTHRVPWFLVAIPIARLFRNMWLSRRVWVAVTSDQVQVLEGSADAWSVPRNRVAAIHVARGGSSRVEFVERSGAPLVTVPLMYSRRQIARMAEVLATPVVDHRE